MKLYVNMTLQSHASLNHHQCSDHAYVNDDTMMQAKIHATTMSLERNAFEHGFAKAGPGGQTSL